MTQMIEPLHALDVAMRAKLSNYPPVFASRIAGRSKRQLGEAFGLTRFGVNLVELAPGARSALLHKHSRQQEFVFVIEGKPVLLTDDDERELEPGMCVGFLPTGPAHCLLNRSNDLVRFLEIGDRDSEDSATYPEDDLLAERQGNGWRFVHRDGRPW